MYLISPRPFPLPNAYNQDRPVTVGDMERFTAAIQATMREMGAQFIRAIVDLHQPEGESEADME